MDGRDREGEGEGSWRIRREGDAERDPGAQTGGALSPIEPAGQGGSDGATGRKARPHSGLGRDEWADLVSWP
jgi:hypothetical protein